MPRAEWHPLREPPSDKFKGVRDPWHVTACLPAAASRATAASDSVAGKLSNARRKRGCHEHQASDVGAAACSKKKSVASLDFRSRVPFIDHRYIPLGDYDRF